jgi:uncharacterized protein (TIGR04255 family)
MPFPDAPRDIYEINTLEEVICQVRFPPILKIDTQQPAEFQERIRKTFPFYKPRPALSLSPELPSELAMLLATRIPFVGGQIAHDFTSTDEKWTLGLTREFIALTCRSYDRWENFKDYLLPVLSALQEVYAPTLFTRLGLRYRNVIRRSVLGLNEVAWSDLLQPWIATVFTSGDITPDVERSGGDYVMRLPDGQGHAHVQHGLVEEASKESCYVIDADCYNDHQTETHNVPDRLDSLHDQARRLFRWCLKDRLHKAMRPGPLSSD